jgi:biotin operon repressor
MGHSGLNKAEAKRTVRAVEKALRAGFPRIGDSRRRGALQVAAEALNIQRQTLRDRLDPAGPLARHGFKINWRLEKKPAAVAAIAPPVAPARTPDALRALVHAALKNAHRSVDDLAKTLSAPADAVLDAIESLKADGVKVERGDGSMFTIAAHAPEAGYVKGPAVEILSRQDNTFVLGAMGDLHAGSRYCRWDARADLVARCEARGAQAIIDTGNWIDGEASFNRYDLEAVGLAAQCKLLAERHPKTKLPIYAVAGDDHEGWYEGREGIDVGWYAEKTMREAGHDWTDLGYMESHVRLVNANSGKSAIAAVVHPGGGSAYALSYRPQKIIESYEGGEKPAVVFFGHYHKLDAGNIRNVWYGQTACCQDQTPFMRKKSIEAHVGGLIATLEQDPRTGAIVGFDAGMIRYFNRAYYDAGRRWSRHGDVGQPPRER